MVGKNVLAMLSKREHFNIHVHVWWKFDDLLFYIFRVDRCSNPLPNCPQLYAPVCGSDGKTYDNDCLLYQAQCNDKSLVKARCSNSLAPSVSVIGINDNTFEYIWLQRFYNP